MTAPGNGFLILVLLLSVLLSGAYAIGRIHQWKRHGVERDEAYRHGYDKASLSIFTMMNRPSPRDASPGATVTPIAAAPGVRAGRRHAGGSGRMLDDQPRRAEYYRTGT